MIKVTNFKKTYDLGKTSLTALNDINIEVEQGEFVAITGKSGIGKSTLINMLGFLDMSYSGKYLFNGIETKKLSDRQLAKIRNKEVGFVFQNYNLISSLNALQNIELPLIYNKTPKNRRLKLATQALETVGLSHRLSHLPSQLSGGQQQRVAIARAIVGNPSLILADEPTGNLDKESTKSVLEFFLKLHSSGKTIVLITHDVDIANMAERVIQLS